MHIHLSPRLNEGLYPMVLAAVNLVVAVLRLVLLGGCFPLLEYRRLQSGICWIFLAVSTILLVLVVVVAKIDDDKRKQRAQLFLLLLNISLSKIFEGELLWNTYTLLGSWLRWYIAVLVAWNFLVTITLSACIFKNVEFSLALKILLPSTSGEYFALFIEYIRLSLEFTRKQSKWLLVAHSCVYLLISILNGIFLGLGWAKLIDDGLLLSAWILSTISTLVTLRIIIRQRVQNYFDRDLEKEHGVDNTRAGRVCGIGDVPLSEFDCSLYSLVRLYDLKLDLTRNDEITSLLKSLEPLELQDESLNSCIDLKIFEGRQILNQLVNLTMHDEIISLLELQDESFELGVLTRYIPKLKELLGIAFLDYSVDWEHRPFDPSLKDVESFCTTHPELSNDYTEAKARMVDLFLRRAEAMIKDGWPMQASWYAHLVGLIPE